MPLEFPYEAQSNTKKERHFQAECGIIELRNKNATKQSEGASLMKYSTTKTYTLKRSIIEFGKRILKGLTRPEQKFGVDMIYGMLAAKSCLLTSIVDQLHERTKKVNAGVGAGESHDLDRRQ